jgi:hypothetical protein
MPWLMAAWNAERWHRHIPLNAAPPHDWPITRWFLSPTALAVSITISANVFFLFPSRHQHCCDKQYIAFLLCCFVSHALTTLYGTMEYYSAFSIFL